MSRKKPTARELRELWNATAAFIDKQDIYHAESIYQSDRVIENAYGFIESVCDIVGYAEFEDEDEKE